MVIAGDALAGARQLDPHREGSHRANSRSPRVFPHRGMRLAHQTSTMSTSVARRHVRELVGWTILSAVMTISKLAVWADGRLAGESDDDAPDERH